MCKVGVFNLYKTSIQHVLNFMFNVKNQTKPVFFDEKITQFKHMHPTDFIHGSFKQPKLGLRLD